MLCIVLAYLLMFAALSNAVRLCEALFLPLIFANASCFHALPWFIDRLFISSLTLHHALCFLSVGFSKFYVHTVFKGLCALLINGT